jgi:hypothetical protein
MKRSWQFPATNILSRQLLREQISPLAVLFGLSALVNLSLEDALTMLNKTQDTERWMIQLGLGVWDLFEGVLLFLVLSWGIPKIRQLTEAHFHKRPFSEPYLNSFLAEYLRLLAQSLMYGLLLILPGVFRYCQLIFIPYLAIFAKPYRDGEVDAVQMSKALTHGFVWRLLLVLIVSMGIASGIEMLPELFDGLHLLPVRVICHALSFFISIWLYAFLYLQFEQAMETQDWRPKNGTHV